MQVKLKTKEGEYRLEATNYGVDFFLNDEYIWTIKHSRKKSEKEWIKLGIEHIKIIRNRIPLRLKKRSFKNVYHIKVKKGT